MLQNRRSERFDVSLQAKIKSASEEITGKIINISRQGMGIQTHYSSFTSSQKVTISIGNGQSFKGKIAWTMMGKIGIELETSLSDRKIEEMVEMSKIRV